MGTVEHHKSRIPIRKRISNGQRSTKSGSAPGPKTALCWLVIVIAIGILFIGGRFLFAPAAGADGFGVPVPRSDAYAHLIHGGTAIYMTVIGRILLLKPTSSVRS